VKAGRTYDLTRTEYVWWRYLVLRLPTEGSLPWVLRLPTEVTWVAFRPHFQSPNPLARTRYEITASEYMFSMFETECRDIKS